MNTLKKILAIIGLAAMAGFIVAVIVLLITGGLTTHSEITFGTLGLFLVCGGAAVVIQKLQDRATEEARKAAEKEAAKKAAKAKETKA